MNVQAIKDPTKPLALIVILTLMCVAAHAQNGMLEIRGVLTSPGCLVQAGGLEQLKAQTHLTGQSCGLTRGPGNPMSHMQIALIGEETLSSLNGTNITKKMVTLTYR
ncbi:MAG: hypothetical protein EB066_04400 [Betaproteobacteria bacterium]|jgi:hypothetical protein|nr:hypothetical protein [Betaproteobacteria bacterium]NDF05665.1 hypothetical protein [Betaproteobacteria bacterium]